MLANTIIEIVFGITFFPFSHADIGSILWIVSRSYIIHMSYLVLALSRELSLLLKRNYTLNSKNHLLTFS